LSRSKKYPDAANEFEKAARHSQIAAAHQNYVWALSVPGQYDRALAAPQQLVELRATDPRARQSALEILAAIYTNLGQKDNARETLNKIRELNPSLNFKACDMVPDENNQAILRCRS
jgi:tetratricopeptide (TPR) repeat protein